jgi:hypothetical protein
MVATTVQRQPGSVLFVVSMDQDYPGPPDAGLIDQLVGSFRASQRAQRPRVVSPALSDRRASAQEHGVKATTEVRLLRRTFDRRSPARSQPSLPVPTDVSNVVVRHGSGWRAALQRLRSVRPFDVGQSPGFVEEGLLGAVEAAEHLELTVFACGDPVAPGSSHRRAASRSRLLSTSCPHHRERAKVVRGGPEGGLHAG